MRIILRKSGFGAFIEAVNIPKSDPIWNFSDPKLVQEVANAYFRDPITIYRSNSKNKKYMIFVDQKWIHFGQMGYEDYTKHKNKERLQSYLARATNMRGNWKDDKFSPNNLSIHLLWPKLDFGGAIVMNPQLYQIATEMADQTYKKPSAYKSGFIVKKYKELGGTYADDDKPKNLKRWFEEEWVDIGNQDYPVYRPTKRISDETPLTVSEIDPQQAIQQIALKQIIRGKANLPKFLSRDNNK